MAIKIKSYKKKYWNGGMSALSYPVLQTDIKQSPPQEEGTTLIWRFVCSGGNEHLYAIPKLHRETESSASRTKRSTISKLPMSYLFNNF